MYSLESMGEIFVDKINQNSELSGQDYKSI